ncbi:NAD(P)/FAD-dependent oxidoreductase [Emcibacter nanhaiensis]|uniref:FAD-binding oxidoreductase n=1 Tax=Emcibacter nanhaiensis TaxID=1505037 RepID=A0A501PK08_9PROT|nr:FAD-binding oxidoreductase [Emcibacter nanhaiensis]TPD60234.1 FAD-binding oxidoreductase [Emcibacter nanhaiensis]
MATYDVLIVGGGLVGCASAWHLARTGASVLLSEKGELNRLASGQNAGSLHFQLEHRLIEHGDAMAEQFAQIIPLSKLAADLWGNLEQDLGEDLEVVMKGGIMAALTEEEVILLEKKFQMENKHGMETQLLSPSEARNIAPYLTDKILAAAYFPREGHANPRLVTPAFARAAGHEGAHIRTNGEVISIAREHGHWTVRLKNNSDGSIEDITADTVLNAAGAWAGRNAQMANIHLPVFPVPLMMNVTERTDPLMPHLLQRAGARLSMKQVGAGNLLIGGGWSSRFRYHDGRPDPTQRPELIQENVIQNLALAAELVPEVSTLHLLRCWTGVVGITADQLPLLGEVPGFPGYYVATGGSGFTLGPVYARLMAELITSGRTDYDISLYSPARFDHINSFMTGR